MSAATDPASPTLRVPLTGFVVAWVVFWLLMLMLELQEALRSGVRQAWPPWLWMLSSCAAASVLAWTQWRRVPQLDGLLQRPWRWFLRAMSPLPWAAPAFIAAVYGVRHAVYALAGQAYHHPPWAEVLPVELLKFIMFYLLFVAMVFGIRAHAALAQAQALQRQAQLLQLAQQLQPHFLFNAINTIASTIHTDPDRADALLTQLAALLRAATDLGRQPSCALADDWRLLQGYAAIMQERFADRLQLQLQLDPAASGCTVPTLLLQPLLENAFRHGVEQCPGPARVRVLAQRQGARLRLSVQCNLGAWPQRPAAGVGLDNLRQRLAAAFGGDAVLALTTPADGGTLATIELPCGC